MTESKHLAYSEGRRKLEENWIILSQIAKLCQNIWRYYNAMPTKPDNEVDISLIVGRSTSVIFILLLSGISSFTINFLSDAAVNLLFILNPTLRKFLKRANHKHMKVQLYKAFKVSNS